MVSVIQRARKLNALLSIRLGPGAAVLSPEVTRIHMEYVVDVDNAAKKFWRTCLPRLKYHNPAIPMTVSRTNTKGSPAALTISFASKPSTSASAPPNAEPTPSTERTKVIDMKNKTASQILAQVISLTKARPVRATAEETRQIRELEEFEERSEEVRQRMAKVNEERRREEAILTQARGEIEAMKET